MVDRFRLTNKEEVRSEVENLKVIKYIFPKHYSGEIQGQKHSCRTKQQD